MNSNLRALTRKAALAVVFGIGVSNLVATGNEPLAAEAGTQISPGLVMPPLDAVHGKMVFAAKGCVLCHAINGIGGTDAPAIDASTMAAEMNPFDFVAKMWNHSQGMIAMQEDEMGEQITFENGQQIADIIAFLHDDAVQKTFSEEDIPQEIKERLETEEDEDDEEGHGSMMKDGSMMGEHKAMDGN